MCAAGFFYSQVFFYILKPHNANKTLASLLLPRCGRMGTLSAQLSALRTTTLRTIASDRGSAPRKGIERFLQPMGEGRAGPRCSGQWEARVPKATTEPLRWACLRDAPTHPPRRPVQSEGSSPQGRLHPSQMKCSPRPKRKSRVVVRPRVLQSLAYCFWSVVVAWSRSWSAALCGGCSWWW